MSHPEQTCQVCLGANPEPWFAPDELWNRVVGSPNGILCPRCFIKLAGEKGIDAVWRVEPSAEGG